MKPPTIFEWYQTLCRHHKFTVFQAVRARFGWLVSAEIPSDCA